MKRNYNDFYIDDNKYEVKDSFIAVAEEIDDNFNGSIADIGCAIGAFPSYLSNRFSSANIVGIEYSDSLLLHAKKNLPNLNLIYGDVNDKHSIDQKFDVITVMGVLSIFDNYEQILSNIISWLKPKGKIIMQTMISDYDIDVFVKYAPSSSHYNKDNMESGWNIISKKSLSLVCKNNSAKLVKVKSFNISVDLEKNNEDLLRSWTELDTFSNRKIYNALHIRQPHKIAIIKKC